MSTVKTVLVVALSALALAGPAGASTPRLAVWDLQTGLAQASRDAFGDVAVKPHAKVAGKGTLVRCGAWCRFSPGWLAFRAKPLLGAADLRAAKVVRSKRLGWTVQSTLTRPALARWTRFAAVAAERSKRRGVPDVLVVAARGVIAAAPYSSLVHARRGQLVLTGFVSRAAANAVVSSLG